MELDNIKLYSVRRAIEIAVQESFPEQNRFDIYPYSLSDLVNQIVFELIKEEYKDTAPKNTVQHYIYKYDIDAGNRKYTRSIQYAQHYKDENNTMLENETGVRLPDLEAPNMNGTNRFVGHSINLSEYLQLRLQGECKLPNKVHEGQINESKKVSEPVFQSLFEEYSTHINNWEPKINEVNPDNLISPIMAYYAMETHFLFDFKYKVTLIAEKKQYPKDIPVDTLLRICSVTMPVPGSDWCIGSPAVDCCIISKWDKMVEKVFSSNETEIDKLEDFLLDCKRIKGVLLNSNNCGKFRLFLSKCSMDEKIKFLKENFWYWDYRPQYEWNKDRIRYFRKLNKVITRAYNKPHIS